MQRVPSHFLAEHSFFNEKVAVVGFNHFLRRRDSTNISRPASYSCQAALCAVRVTDVAHMRTKRELRKRIPVAFSCSVLTNHPRLVPLAASAIATRHDDKISYFRKYRLVRIYPPSEAFEFREFELELDHVGHRFQCFHHSA